MSFRDDREALLGRLAALEAELGREREGSDARRDLASELDALAAQVRAATGELDADRAALREVSAALERLRGRVGPATPTATGPDPGKRVGPDPPLDTTPGWGARYVVFGLAVIIGVLTLVLLLAQRADEDDAKASRAADTQEDRDARNARITKAIVEDMVMVPFSCEVASEPPGAEVQRRGVVMGKTPMTLRLESNQRRSGYRLTLDGYYDAPLDIPRDMVFCKTQVNMTPRPARN